MPSVFETATTAATPITFVTKATWDAIRGELPAPARQFAAANDFAAKPGKLLVLPAADGGIAQVLFGLEDADHKARDPFRPGALPGLLPPGVYRFANAPHDTRLAALAFALGCYRFGRYRTNKIPEVRLVPPDGIDTAEITRMADAAALARDLINTPSNDMGPAELAEVARDLATRFGAAFNCIDGDELAQNFPLIHAVGMASTRSPRLIELSWGDPAHPKVTLVGKGVCFDTGGLDLKPSSGMLIMKKDMGGAANVLALAQMVMDAKLKLRLRVLIPAVENAVAGNAFRPLDIFKSRKGITVEIGNTDAEGRLVLADALALADEETPDLLIDLGTLTGAARVALGPDLPPFYTNDEALAGDVASCAKSENDPLWRMPLWPAYDAWLDSKTADITNAPSGGFAGSITCALFLQRFVEHARSWLHVDIYGWTPSAKPGRPEGGECQAARAIYKLLSQRYA
ncbi:MULTISPECIES: leucyl aminopeptidase family protein [Bradyrhizobium]|uniref:Leucyl aminopeptidase n=1 Tax=Bradyrhizobium elkanii TaxID=29448 RepID=A0A1E3EG25_BRAEL|nr:MULTISPECIES: leucyl aminopeptidase family protein [Bradyrhizobium]MBP1291439.1 leucyl aminopeptidase [Bradyrhizobium elkanii]MCP1928250.1 leucyl aminopeptidase [Bradyrhizobium elkanii]MCS3474354.1 leucyl aminopeptidase [Bradyrhizobium elkanii]MCS3581138.1 leucyl aminopeptidase [Bradyrhizobium elkanii]MCS3724013.1 leucyl aminopeptidase [Bradyrhizobium elkanii]